MTEKHSTTGVLYLRMSSDRQEASIPQQIDWAHRTCKRERVEILREFRDEAIAGDEIARRPGLQALIAYCEERYRQGQPVGAVVTWNGDRFSRADSIRTAGMLCRLLDAGTTLMLDNEGWTDFENETDRVMHSIKQDLGRSGYVRSLAQNITRAAIKRAREGLWCGGPVPYAYVLGPDGHLALGDPAEVDAVRFMFEAYDRGLSLKQVAAELQRRGYPVPRSGSAAPGRAWTKAAVWEKLRHPVYTGTMPFARRRTGKYFVVSGDRVIKRKGGRTSKGTVRDEDNPKEEQIHKPDAHPAIIGRELFDRVQRRLFGSRLAFRDGEKQDRRLHSWPLSGLLYCAECKARMWGAEVKARSDRPGKVRTYACSTYLEHGSAACHHNSVHESVILPLVFQALHVALSDPDVKELVRKTLAARLKRSRGSAGANLDSLRRRAADLGEKVRLTTERLALCPADLVGDVAGQLRTFKDDREDVLRQLAEAEKTAAAGEAEAVQMQKAMAAFDDLAEIVKDPDRQTEAGAAAQALVEKVELHFSHKRQGKRFFSSYARGTVHFKGPLEVLGTLKVTAPERLQERSDDVGDG
jgi:DNA invertase Pin-like site-specific DNA recombinase